MRERIERISPVRGVSYDVTRSYEERHGYSGGSHGRGFRDMLQQAMKAHKPFFSSAPKDMPPSEPYSLDVTRTVHATFYKEGSTLERIGHF